MVFSGLPQRIIARGPGGGEWVKRRRQEGRTKRQGGQRDKARSSLDLASRYRDQPASHGPSNTNGIKAIGPVGLAFSSLSCLRVKSTPRTGKHTKQSPASANWSGHVNPSTPFLALGRQSSTPGVIPYGVHNVAHNHFFTPPMLSHSPLSDFPTLDHIPHFIVHLSPFASWLATGLRHSTHNTRISHLACFFSSPFLISCCNNLFELSTLSAHLRPLYFNSRLKYLEERKRKPQRKFRFFCFF